MITVNVNNQEKEITRIQFYERIGGVLVERTISTIKDGNRIIYQGIRSCYGSGTWINEKPWLNDDIWKNT